MNRRLAIPIVLSLAGLLLLTGCIYIPTFGVSIDHTSNLNNQIGDAKSTQPIRLMVSTRAEVEQIFGTPTHVSLDGRHTSYLWRTRRGVFFLPICFWNELGYLPDDTERHFLLTYNADHILTHVDLVNAVDPRLTTIKWEGRPGPQQK